MSQESLSALFDGECSPAEVERLLNEMQQTPELKSAFSRMCLSREAQEGTRVSRDQPCICAGVMSQLDAEPKSSSTVVALYRKPAPAFQWRPLAGLAAAASFGALAVLVAMPQSRDAAISGAAPSAVVDGQLTKVSVPVRPLPPNVLAVSASQDEVDDLRNYMIEHSNTLADRGMGGSLSYARFTAHTADYRPAVESVTEVKVEERR
ncbi:MAG TPA: sigma-E factor negative regulatory protein [Solimonas sp.]|nr:sigma-E factor negative regulatory protein [Solimonas sp.]